MISLELSSIQYNSLQSAVISAQVAEFLRNGGEISTTPPMQPVPKPYGRSAAYEAPKKPALKIKNPVGRPSRLHDPKLIERIAVMGETMTCKAVSEEVKLSQNQLYCLATRHGFRFLSAEHPGHKNITPPKLSADLDAKNVERIKSFIALGVTRRQAMLHMGMGTSQFYRLLTTYEINYPKAVPGNTWVMKS